MTVTLWRSYKQIKQFAILLICNAYYANKLRNLEAM